MPLTDQQLVQTFKTQIENGIPGVGITALLIGEGHYSNVGQIVAQLEHAGFTKAGAQKAVTSNPSVLQSLLSAGAGFVFVPGSVADALLAGGGEAAGAGEAAAATTAAAGAAGGTAAAASGITSLLSKYGSGVLLVPLLEWITTGKNWVRVLEYVGGAAMIAIAMRELAMAA